MNKEMTFKRTKVLQEIQNAIMKTPYSVIAGLTRNPLKKVQEIPASAGMTALIGKTTLLLSAFCFLLSTSFAQTFSGGSGTQADPYKISKPEDLVELSAITNVNKGIATDGKYFEMTNCIDMATISNFSPIGMTDRNWNTYHFSGNFDGKGFAIKNLTIIDSNTSLNVALFGSTKGASITNLILDNAYISTTSTTVGISTFVSAVEDSIYMDNCMVINCRLKGKFSTDGFIGATLRKGRINNCHVVLATMEARSIINGFGYSFGDVDAEMVRNSSVSFSTFTGTSTSATTTAMFNGFVDLAQSKFSGCYVSNCTFSANTGMEVSGFANTLLGEINNCGVQSLMIRKPWTEQPMHKSIGFIKGIVTYQGSDMYPTSITNSYAACEVKDIDIPNGHYSNDHVFYGFTPRDTTPLNPNMTLANCYYLTDTKDTKLECQNYRGEIVGKSGTELKSTNMLAHPGSVDNSLNYGQTTPAWKQDFAVNPINKGYPILGWMDRFSYVSTYHATDITKTSATLHGLTFANSEGIITERGFQYRKVGTTNWTTVKSTDTTFNISYALAGLTKNTTYECFVYMKAPSIQHGDTVQFTTLGDSVNIVNYLPETSNLSIYPNPTDGQLKITNYELRENAVVEIFSVVGQVVFTSAVSTLSPETTIDISHLAKGMYYLRIGEKTVKFVKE